MGKKEKRGCNCEQCVASSKLPKKCQACDCRSLVDGAYEIVFMYKPSSPGQTEWRNNWLAKAKTWGAGFDA
jgi:predicted nucleic acid binding AN1-type Zn finger protein